MLNRQKSHHTYDCMRTSYVNNDIQNFYQGAKGEYITIFSSISTSFVWLLSDTPSPQKSDIYSKFVQSLWLEEQM